MEKPSDEIITFTYDCTTRERREGEAVARALPGKKPRLLWLQASGVTLITCLLPVLPIGLSIAIYNSRSDLKSHFHRIFNERLSASALVVTLLGLILSGATIVIDRRTRAVGKPTPGDRQMSIGLDGLTFGIPERLDVISWDYFRGVSEGPSVFALRIGKVRSLVIPKRLFASEVELVRARDLLTRCTTRTATPFSDRFPVVQS